MADGEAGVVREKFLPNMLVTILLHLASLKIVWGLVRQISALSHSDKSAHAFCPGSEGTRDHFRGQNKSPVSPGWPGSGSESRSHLLTGRLRLPPAELRCEYVLLVVGRQAARLGVPLSPFCGSSACQPSSHAGRTERALRALFTAQAGRFPLGSPTSLPPRPKD